MESPADWGAQPVSGAQGAQNPADWGAVSASPADWGAQPAPQASSDARIPTGSFMGPGEEQQAMADAAQQHPLLANAASAVADTARGLPAFAAQLPGYAYQGAKFASGSLPQQEEVAAEVLKQAIPQGQQMAKGLQSPVGSKEFDSAAIQAAMMAAPGLELARGIRPEAPVTTETSRAEPVRPATASEAPVAPETPPVAQGATAGPWDDFTMGPETNVPYTEQASGAGTEMRSQTARASVPTADELRAAVSEGRMDDAVAIAQGMERATIKPNEFQTSEAEAGQRDTAPTVPAPVAASGEPGVVDEGGQGYSGRTAGETAGTSNRVFQDTYGGEEGVSSGQGADTGQLLDNARAAIRSGAVDPYSVLSKTRDNGIANPEEYATLAAEHERLVNDAVAKQKAGDPTAPQAAQAAEDFANAIQPHKTAASDVFRLMQGDLNYDMSTPFGMEQYMKAELGRGMKPNEAPRFNRMSQDISRGESDVQQAVARSDAKVQARYAKVRDIPIEEAAARVKEWLGDCQV